MQDSEIKYGTLQTKTKDVALRVIRLVESLPANMTGQILGRQILRCGTSVGANYRAAMRAKSKADMINKLKIVEEEADETLYWLDLLAAAGLIPIARLQPLIDEFDSILAMTVASIKTLRNSRY
jgi:four helix bundle protein